MTHFVTKDNVSLMLFRIEEDQVPPNMRFNRWQKLLSCFHYGAGVDLHIVYIQLLGQHHIGFSLRAQQDVEIRAKRYAEGMAYQLMYHFQRSEIVPMEHDEVLELLTVLEDLQELANKHHDKKVPLARFVFAQVVNPLLILDKFAQFYLADQKAAPTSLENRIGIKPKCDSRLVPLLEQAYLGYRFNFYATKSAAAESAKSGREDVVEENRLESFLEHMMVPHKYLHLLQWATSTTEMFDAGTIQLLTPTQVAELIIKD